MNVKKRILSGVMAVATMASMASAIGASAWEVTNSDVGRTRKCGKLVSKVRMYTLHSDLEASTTSSETIKIHNEEAGDEDTVVTVYYAKDANGYYPITASTTKVYNKCEVKNVKVDMDWGYLKPNLISGSYADYYIPVKWGEFDRDGYHSGGKNAEVTLRFYSVGGHLIDEITKTCPAIRGASGLVFSGRIGTSEYPRFGVQRVDARVTLKNGHSREYGVGEWRDKYYWDNYNDWFLNSKYWGWSE